MLSKCNCSSLHGEHASAHPCMRPSSLCSLHDATLDSRGVKTRANYTQYALDPFLVLCAFNCCLKLKLHRFPNDTELNLIMKNQFSAMSVRFKTFSNAKRIDQFVECLIELYNEVYVHFHAFVYSGFFVVVVVVVIAPVPLPCH